MIYRKKYESEPKTENSFLTRTELSLSAKGLLCYLLSFPDNWDFTITKIAQGTQTKRGRLESALSELGKFGYIHRTQFSSCGNSGRYIDVYEDPLLYDEKNARGCLRGKNVNNSCESGYVYVIKMGDHYKIGISIEPSRRLKEFTKLPHEIETIICDYKKGYKEIEKELHEKYLPKRERGEWFKLEEEDIVEIKEYLSKK